MKKIIGLPCHPVVVEEISIERKSIEELLKEMTDEGFKIDFQRNDVRKLEWNIVGCPTQNQASLFNLPIETYFVDCPKYSEVLNLAKTLGLRAVHPLASLWWVRANPYLTPGTRRDFVHSTIREPSSGMPCHINVTHKGGRMAVIDYKQLINDNFTVAGNAIYMFQA